MDVKEERGRIRKTERILHFMGDSFFDEPTAKDKSERIAVYERWIQGSPEVLSEFEKYHPTSLSFTLTFESRISGLAMVIANMIAGKPIFSRSIVDEVMFNLPELRDCNFFRYDPVFGAEVDAMLEEKYDGSSSSVLAKPNKSKIKIADVACAPKRGGGANLNFLMAVLPQLFPDREFEFYGYDIDFMDKYPDFDKEGRFNGWEKAYVFGNKAMAEYNKAFYRNSTMPMYNIVPRDDGDGLVDTFAQSHDKYDIIINSMFYSVLEMHGEPKEKLEMIRKNLLSLRSEDGVLFLNTCDDCFKIYPAGGAEPMQQVVPLISSLANMESKVNDTLIGGRYCNGIYDYPDDVPVNGEAKSVMKKLFTAHRLANSGMTFLDRLFEAYERVNEGRPDLSCLTEPGLQISPERREQARSRIYSAKREEVR